MISANVRSRAVLAQERAHERRNFHRLEQKAAERDDQTYRKLIRAYDRVIEKKVQAEVEGDKEAAAILAAASDQALAELGLVPEAAPESAASPVVDVASASVVEGGEPGAGDAPVDGSTEAGAADDDRSPDDGADRAADAASDVVAPVAVAGVDAASVIAVAPGEAVVSTPIVADDLAARVLAVLRADRCRSVTSFEWVKLLQRTKLSPARLKKALLALEADGYIRQVKAAEPGTKTFLLRQVEKAA